MRCALYRHFDKDGALLYVGVSINPISRNEYHSLCSHWRDEIVTIKICRLDSVEAAKEAERAAIISELPKYNKEHALETTKKPSAPRKTAGILIEHMKRQGLNQRELAEKLDVHETQVSKWMRGKQKPNVQNMIHIAKRLGMPLEDLL